jgi:hypothetical protein
MIGGLAILFGYQKVVGTDLGNQNEIPFGFTHLVGSHLLNGSFFSFK